MAFNPATQHPAAMNSSDGKMIVPPAGESSERWFVHEAFAVGLISTILSLIILSFVSRFEKHFEWDALPHTIAVFFLKGMLAHSIFEMSGANDWLCPCAPAGGTTLASLIGQGAVAALVI